MNKRDFFIYSIQHEYYKERGWLESIWGILLENSPHSHLTEYGVYLKDKKLYGYINDKEEEIEGFTFDKPLYIPQEELTIKAHEMKCCKHDIVTSYGIALMNLYFQEFPYGEKATFINSTDGKPLSGKTFNAIAKDFLISGKGTIDEHRKFEMAVGVITVLVEHSVTPASEKTICVNPENAKVKEELLIKHKDNLHDGATIAQIQTHLENLDKEYLKGDEAEYYYTLSKVRAARTRIYNMYGGAEDFADSSKTILMENSLHEGITLKDIPMMNNEIRRGSASRAVATQQGGAEVKLTGRLLQNYKFIDGDCGSKIGVTRTIKNDTYLKYAGRYLVGSKTPLSKSDLERLIGKTVEIRSSQWCLTPGNAACSICIGDEVINTKLAPTALGNSLTSTLMGISMSAMHTSGLTVHRYDFKNRIT
jgi:hypothetical protein